MRLLLVEDERSLAAAVQRGLEAEGFSVAVAYDGRDGLWQATEFQFDVIVLDIMLPLINGYDICRRLRAGGSTTPILMLTAKDGEYDEADALDLGADDFLTKPFSFVVLLARLRALMRRGAVERAPVLRADDIELDPAARRCWRGGVEVTLTAREFALAEYLIRHKDEAVTKTQIIEHVWDPNFAGESNVVEVYVGYLRRKLDKPFGRSSIETVRGVGYRLSARPPKPTGRGRRAPSPVAR
jgi:DNA-binding response OmpR family regulator